MLKIIYSTIVLFLIACLSSACEEKEEFEAAITFSEIINSYSGQYFYKKPAGDTLIHSNHLAIVSGNQSFKDLLEVSIEGFPKYVFLSNIRKNSTSKYSGKVLIYSSEWAINIEGEEIAGNGLFVYDNGNLSLTYTADEINKEWTLSFEGSDK